MLLRHRKVTFDGRQRVRACGLQLRIVGLDESLGLRQQPDRVAVHYTAWQNALVTRRIPRR